MYSGRNFFQDEKFFSVLIRLQCSSCVLSIIKQIRGLIRSRWSREAKPAGPTAENVARQICRLSTTRCAPKSIRLSA